MNKHIAAAYADDKARRVQRSQDALPRLLDLIANIDRDEDGDAMLDREGLDELKLLAREVRRQQA